MHQALRLRCDAGALRSNYSTLRNISRTTTGAAVKANAYGLGAVDAVRHLLDEGCRDFFVSTWWEAAELSFLPEGTLAVLHGYGADDEPQPGIRPVLLSAGQIARWKQSGRSSLPCDVMVDTGMNRLGLRMDELTEANGLNIHTFHSHLACADEDHPLTAVQLRRFKEACSQVAAGRYSLANSAGALLGPNYAFDLIRPGLALYGGMPREEAHGHIRPVATPEARTLQLRRVEAGDSVGYNATFVAPRSMSVAIANVGYADGYWRALASSGVAVHEGTLMPIIGRISMDLIAIDASDALGIKEGDWLGFPLDLERMATASGFSQYELLTGLGRRWQRIWT